jgi:hypothetical protein
MKPEVLLSYLQETAAGFYTEPDESAHTLTLLPQEK